MKQVRWRAVIIARDAENPFHPALRRAIHASESPRLTEAKKPSLWQALGDKRMAAVLALGFASGLPFNLTLSTLQAWLTSAHVDIKTIGVFTIVGVPYMLKFLWAPLLDRYLPPILGRRRGWILILQLALCVAIAVMGSGSPVDALQTLAVFAIVVAFLSASQDIVVDAYRVDLIPPSERALAAAASTFGYRSGMMFASAVLVLIAGYLGWRLAYLLVSAIMLSMALITLRAPEPETPGRPPPTLEEAVMAPLKDLLKRWGAWGFLLLVLLYKVGDAFALSLYSAFNLSLGFSLQQLSLGKLDMTISTMTGVAIGGAVYLRWGMFRSLLIFGIGQAFTNLLYMWLALSGKKLWLMLLATSVDTCIGGMGQAAFIAFLVAQCNPSFSATQYALLSALAAVPRTVVSAGAGYVVAAVGWPRFFVVTFLAALPGLLLLIALSGRIRDLEARQNSARS